MFTSDDVGLRLQNRQVPLKGVIDDSSDEY